MIEDSIVAPLMCIPPIGFFIEAKKANSVIIDAGEHYVKQTIRNRYHILSANGVLALSIPVIGQEGAKVPTGQIIIDYSKDWQRNHLRTVDAAYRSSPFYDYYADTFREILLSGSVSLRDFAEKSLKTWVDLLELEFEWNVNDRYSEGSYSLDLRGRIKQPGDFPTDRDWKPYVQVFADRFAFQENLSVLDILFNLGPEAGSLIKEMS
ncbi:MAG TPA: WbqC family protein [Cryomorphaceae bacterium]|nr:WbqC family protein [Cryomorphaceae bacterium]